VQVNSEWAESANGYFSIDRIQGRKIRADIGSRRGIAERAFDVAIQGGV
jgi:hypothetical protein